MSYIGELIGLERKLKETTDEKEREQNDLKELLKLQKNSLQ